MFMSPHEESTTHTEVVHSQEVVERGQNATLPWRSIFQEALCNSFSWHIH